MQFCICLTLNQNHKSKQMVLPDANSASPEGKRETVEITVRTRHCDWEQNFYLQSGVPLREVTGIRFWEGLKFCAEP